MGKIDIYLADANKRYNVANAKIDAYCESMVAQYAINCKKAELKILQESGTEDDLNYLYEAAEGGAVESLKKAIEKIIEAFKKFVNEIKLKILSIIASKETDKNIEAIEKKVRFNPFLSKKKVKVEDTKKQLAVVAWAQAEYQKLISKIKSGKEVSPEEATQVHEEFTRKLKIAGGVAAAITVTVGAAILIVKKSGKSMSDEIEKIRKATDDLIGKAKDAGGEMHIKSQEALKRISSGLSKTGQAAIEALVNRWKSTLTIIRSATSKAKGGAKDNVTEESAVEQNEEKDEIDEFFESMSFDDEDDKLFDESDAQSIVDDIETDLFGESSDDEDDDDDFSSLFEEDVLGDL